MRHLEVFIVESIKDLDELSALQVDVDDNESCGTCMKDVGVDYSGDLEPFCAVVEDEDDIWVICTDCASSVI
jgi:hypothetical protein